MSLKSEHTANSVSARLKIVTLENFYKNIYSPENREMFMKLMQLREQGYGHEYPENFLPVDVSDFVVCHHLFCIEDDRGLVPIAGGTHASMKRCDQYNVALPIDSLGQKSKNPIHGEAVRDLLQDFRQNGKDLVNGVRLTIAQEYRGNREISEQVKELVAGLLVADTEMYGLSAIVTDAIVRFKTDRLFHKMGFRPMEHQGKELPLLKKHWAKDEPALLMIAHQLSDWTHECYDKHRDAIEGRVLIGQKRVAEKKAA